MMSAVNGSYRIQSRESGEIPFHDCSDWLTCDQCIFEMRDLFSRNPKLDFQIVDKSGTVVASTVDKKAARAVVVLTR